MKTITIFLLIISLSIKAQQRHFFTQPDLEGKIGKHFPIENYKNSDDRNFNPNDLKGKITLINFWSTICEPCIKELPYLNKLKEILGDKVNFIAITQDNKDKVERFLAKREFNFLHITDSGQELKSYFPILRNPLTFIVDKNGNIKEITGIVDETKFDTIVKILNE
ncbi:thiol-disulfide isomerase/thioredoxin [Chryseobacterium ginsenosidimutans]|uniref:TlpA family protein disulfide reductase n=1 Tax=Chryseobacterium ginsenosidimutans TaxID=687846 RepID=UPI0027821E3E|nr:TlpA disulfide reductase family protein [Chryseobacterium ginsenosidimutans]MDQ0592950.1 thiol-disulfide isomerase/thioredoxin [Chryseobacterium ginsenosidimutans]